MCKAYLVPDVSGAGRVMHRTCHAQDVSCAGRVVRRRGNRATIDEEMHRSVFPEPFSAWEPPYHTSSRRDRSAELC